MLNYLRSLHIFNSSQLIYLHVSFMSSLCSASCYLSIGTAEIIFFEPLVRSCKYLFTPISSNCVQSIRIWLRSVSLIAWKAPPCGCPHTGWLLWSRSLTIHTFLGVAETCCIEYNLMSQMKALRNWNIRWQGFILGSGVCKWFTTLIFNNKQFVLIPCMWGVQRAELIRVGLSITILNLSLYCVNL